MEEVRGLLGETSNFKGAATELADREAREKGRDLRERGA